MELNQAILKRRSIRAFKIDDIPKNLIFEMLESVRLAPSAKNRQTWYFVVIKNDIKNKIA